MPRTTIGVDIGSSSVKAVQVGRGNQIVRAGAVNLPAGTVTGGEIRDVQALSDALRLLWKQAGFSRRTAAFGVAGVQTLVRQVELPWEPPDVFRESLPLRVAKDMPVDPSEMVLDYYPLGVREVKGVWQQQALIVGTFTLASENAEHAFAGAKLRSSRADYTPFALIRASAHLNPEWKTVPGPPQPGQEQPCQAIVDVGADITTVTLHDQGRPLFVRTVAAGSSSVDRALADQFGVSAEAADLLKRRLGLGGVTERPGDEEAAAELPAGAEGRAQTIINAMAGSLVQVARESIEYYLNATPVEANLTLVQATGGGTLLPGYIERLAAELQTETAPLAPLTLKGSGRVKSDETLTDAQFGAAFGLATGV